METNKTTSPGPGASKPDAQPPASAPPPVAATVAAPPVAAPVPTGALAPERIAQLTEHYNLTPAGDKRQALFAHVMQDGKPAEKELFKKLHRVRS